MIIRSKAPLRISFAGGGTDISPYAEERGGVVLNATIDKYAYGSLSLHDEPNVAVESLDYEVIAKYVHGHELSYDGELDLVKAVLKTLNSGQRDGLDIFIHSDAPPGSGLGSSSTMVVALIALFKQFRKLPLSNYEIAELAYHIERVELGIQGGMQDQYAATFGGFNLMEFGRHSQFEPAAANFVSPSTSAAGLPQPRRVSQPRQIMRATGAYPMPKGSKESASPLARETAKDSSVVVNPLRIDQEIINELQYNLLLCFTGQTRLSANIIQTQKQNYADRNQSVMAAMDELKAITIEMKNALLQGRLEDFGKLLHDGWINKKKMAKQIANRTIDNLYRAARENGALGGKLLGAGGGGYLLVYCASRTKHTIAEALESLGGTVVDFKFDRQGVQTWEVRPFESPRLATPRAHSA